jgi:hypothetical protein
MDRAAGARPSIDSSAQSDSADLSIIAANLRRMAILTPMRRTKRSKKTPTVRSGSI